MALTHCLDCGVLVAGESRCRHCSQVRHAGLSRRRKRGRGWMELRAEVIKRDRCCQGCGAYGPGVVYRIHHVVPLAAGGSNHIDNLTLLCSDRHDVIHGAEPSQRREHPTA